jgi:hypothetical protein
MALHSHTDTDRRDSGEALALLEAGIPLTLLLDLAVPVDSSEVYNAEPGMADWLPAAKIA